LMKGKKTVSDLGKKSPRRLREGKRTEVLNAIEGEREVVRSAFVADGRPRTIFVYWASKKGGGGIFPLMGKKGGGEGYMPLKKKRKSTLDFGRMNGDVRGKTSF